MCDLIDPRLPRPEAWWWDLQLLARVAHNMNSGLALWPPSEAGERKPLSVYSHWIKLGRKLLLLSRRFLRAVCLHFFCCTSVCCSLKTLVYFHGTCPKTGPNVRQFGIQQRKVFLSSFLPDLKPTPLSFSITGAGQRSVHIEQPTWWNPNHAQQRCYPQYCLWWLRGSLYASAVAILHAHGKVVLNRMLHHISVW